MESIRKDTMTARSGPRAERAESPIVHVLPGRGAVIRVRRRRAYRRATRAARTRRPTGSATSTPVQAWGSCWGWHWKGRLS